MIRVGFYSLLTVAWIVMFFYALLQDNGLVVALSIFMTLLYSARLGLLALELKESGKSD